MSRLDNFDVAPAENIKVFIPRATRYDFDSSVAFYTDEGRASGRCINLSESGMLARFDVPLDVWLRGELIVATKEFLFTTGARIARVDGHLVGLAYHPRNEQERESIQKLMTLAARLAQPSDV